MKQVLILGAGTAGTLVANLLSHQLDARNWQITVLDQSPYHIYQPGLLFLPFGIYGYERGQDLVRKIRDPLAKNVKFLGSEIRLIDHKRKLVETLTTHHPYDILICALGSQIVPNEVEGLGSELGERVFTFYTLEHAEKLRLALDRMQSGRLVLNICDMPIKCPVAPIEFMFLADYYFQRKGIRDRIELVLVTPLSGAFTKPNANRVLTQLAQKKGIEIIPNFNIASVDADANCIRSFEGANVEYDLLVTIPPHIGSKVIDDSGLGDGNGYALTDPRTLKSLKSEHIYFIGDNTNVNTSKAGSVAHFEAETVVANVLREIEGKSPLATYDGHSNCFIESGHHKALLIDFNYDMEPLLGSFPMPYGGPFSLLEETYLNHMGKMTFQWVYWNMLLPGHLGQVPLLPAHMSILGKDIRTSPQARHAQSLHVKDVMTKEVITINQGSSITEAANLISKKRISGLPVLDSDGRLVGILTEGDFISALDIDRAGPLESVVLGRRTHKRMGTIVDDLMTKNPFTIKADDTLQAAVAAMERHRVKRLVVVSDTGQIQGIISRADLIKLFAMK